MSPAYELRARPPSRGFLLGAGLVGGELGECGELVDVGEVESVGLVGVAEQQVGAVGCELCVVVGAAADADEREVRWVVAATPAEGPEVVHLESGTAVAARPAALGVAEAHTTHDLGCQRGA